MKVDLFDFDLPEERIALRPALPRESARLLRVPRSGSLEDRIVADLPALLREGDLLVFNDTRVIPARLVGRRERGTSSAKIEAMLHLRVDGETWMAFARPAKKLASGEIIRFGGRDELSASVESKGADGEVCLRFDRSGTKLDEAVAAAGALPLPPYIAGRRPTDEQDASDYQTIYAREAGAVAAPTAGLHFTKDLFKKIERRGIGRAFVTLHVGAGTFLPVKSDDTERHHMHSEYGTIDGATADLIRNARADGRRIVAVGTTSLRLLESAARSGEVRPFTGTTDIFITPGFEFQAVDVLMTNFHLPRSTLFMLVSAFSGLDRMRAAYAHAVEMGYRFYSYGDACLLERQ